MKRIEILGLILFLALGAMQCSDDSGGAKDPGAWSADGFGDICVGCQSPSEDTHEVVITVRDSDRDGLPDDSEDYNQNGIFEPELGETDWQDPDTDDDGLLDGIEDLNRDGHLNMGELDPRNPDTDGDGLLDSLEDLNHNGVYDPDTDETDGLKADTDEDGLSDFVEYGCNYLGQKTNPNKADTDDDGLPDGVEDRNHNGQIDPGETDPTEPDSDGDLISDGCEDLNQNGIVDPGETDPSNVDSDGDGLVDGGPTGECRHPPYVGCPDFDNAYQCMTNPTMTDTDGDGLSDRVEVYSNYGGGVSSNPRDPDSDDDGLPDGAEDFNRNGLFDINIGELNPIDPESYDDVPDPYRPQAIVCGPIDPPLMLEDQELDIRFVYSDHWIVSPLDFGITALEIDGWALDDRNTAVTGFLLRKRPDPGTNALRQARQDSERLGASPFFEQTLTTWDGYQARLTTYRIDSTVNMQLKEYRNRYVAALGDIPFANTIEGLPDTTSIQTRHVELTILTVYRSEDEVILIGALIPYDTPPSEEARRAIDNLVNGTALARYTDVLAHDDQNASITGCDVFRITNLPIIDFLFVIDDTSSMRPYQEVLQAATDQIFDAIENAFISARWTITSTDVGENEGTWGNLTQCGLTNDPVGVDGSIWAPFTESFKNAFRCRVRDPIGVQNCDPQNVEHPGFAEYGLTCARWAIEYIQGRRGEAEFKDQQRPRSGLILIIISDEGSNLLTFPADLDNGAGIPEPDKSEMLDWLGVYDWTQVDGQVVADHFIPYFKVDASQGPYSQTTPFFIYSREDVDFRVGYYETMDAVPGTFEQGASLDIRRCRDNPECQDIPDFIGKIIGVANALASPFNPTHVPITTTMRLVVERGFTEDHVELYQSHIDGWHYSPSKRTVLFFGPNRPNMLDGFAISYLYWVHQEQSE